MRMIKIINRTRTTMDDMIAKQLSKRRLKLEQQIQKCEEQQTKLKAEYKIAIEQEMEYSAGAFREEWEQ